MSYQIRRNRVPCYNNTPQLMVAERQFNVRWPILDSPSDYTAVIESASIDLAQAVLDPSPAYEIMIFCELKEPDPVPEGLVYGPNYFKFQGPLRTVNQFMKWLQDTLIKVPQPYNLGLFQLDPQDFFTYDIQPTDYANAFTSGNFRVYFNSQLAPIMDGFVNLQGEPLAAGGQLFYLMTTQSGHSTSTIDTLFRLNKIESFLFMTTLPITGTEVLDLELNDAREMKILGTVEMNSLTYNLRTKTDWKYSPDVLRHYTMNQTDTIQGYSIRVLIQYNNGAFMAHYLNPGERFIANIAFYPRQGVADV